MMPSLTKIYDEAFFKEWGILNKPYVDKARRIAQTLFSQLHPRSLIDLGCGCGVYSQYFREKGVEVVSIDGVIPPADHSFPISIEIRDLTEPFENRWGEFDVVLCLEVAEHIPPDLSDVFLKNLTQFSSTLVISCAPPHQGGHHHVNEQPKRYWVQRLAEFGFQYNRRRTGRLQEEFKKDKTTLMWMGEHISIYEKKEKLPMFLPLVGRR